MAMKQITIAGGGLAGLALGLALRRRFVPVRLMEAASYPRHRVCGEFISGIQNEELIALGMDDLLSAAVRPRDTAWFDCERPMFRATLPEAAYGLSRYQLDAALAERFVMAGGELLTGTRYHGNKEEEGTVLASGRVPGASPWLGLKAHYEGLNLSADLEVHLGTSAYVGLTKVEGNLVNVCGLFHRATSLSSGQQALVQAVQDAGFPGLALRLREANLCGTSLKGINRFNLGWQLQNDAAVRIGDAAVMIPPFTGNGMTMALQSALAAVDPLIKWSRGESSWPTSRSEIRNTLRRLFSSRLRWARALQWLLLQPWGRKLCSHMITHRWMTFDTFYHKLR